MPPRSSSRTTHFALAAVSVLALLAGAVIPGSLPLVAGMLVYLALPLWIHQPIGVPTRAGEGTRYVSGPTTAEKIDSVARWLGIVTWSLYGLSWLMTNGALWPAMLFAWLGIGFTGGALHGLYVRLVQSPRAPWGLTLDTDTLTLSSSAGSRIFRYSDVEKVEDDGGYLVVTVAGERQPPITVAGPPALANEMAHALLERKAQWERAASNRASGRTTQLERPSGMSAREWFARIDAVVATSRSQGAYRAGGLEDDTLWALLGDEAADGSTRAAAARILSASNDEEVHVRVAAALAGIGDAGTRRRAATATRQDTEEAAAELEAIELEELREASGA